MKAVQARLWKKFALIMMTIVLCLPIGGELALAIDAEIQPLTVANDFMDVSVNKQTGRFSVMTKMGSPLKSSDDNKPLLFRDKLPETSFTTFRINGKDFIYGNGYGFLGTNGYFTFSPENKGLTNQSVWHVEGLEIIQTLTLVDDQTNPNAGNIKISYKIKNTTKQNQNVGSRILLDTMLGPQDASPISLSGGNTYIRNETKIEGSLPYYWRATDNPLNPKVMSYGFLQGWGNKSPNRMIIAHWNGISETKWDYTVNPQLDFTSTQNAYGSADSAVAMYWDPSNLAPGQDAVFETYYGLGSFFTSQKEANYGLQIAAPKQVKVNDNGTGYKETEFVIRVDIDNSIDRSVEQQNVQAVLGLPAELELVQGERSTKAVGSMKAGEVKTVTWKVRPKPQKVYKAAQFQVIVQAAGSEENIQASFVVLPALSGKIPEVQVLEALPKKLYMLDENPTIALQGKGFEVLKGSSDWQVQVIRERDGSQVLVPSTDVTVVDDKQITIRLNDTLWPPLKEEPGTYIIRITAGMIGTFEKKVELTSDKKYKTRDYGILLVVGENMKDEGNETYQLVPVENESKLADLKHQYANASKEALLEFRGPIRSLAGDNSYFEIGAGATINSVIRHDTSKELSAIFGQASQKMVIQKNDRDLSHEGNYIALKGNGVLSIPGFPFSFGPFSIEMVDGSRYSLEAKADDGQKPIEINWEVLKGLSVLQHMSFFQVEIKNAVIGNESVSFGGSVSMNFNPGQKKEEAKDPNGNNNQNPPPPPAGNGQGDGAEKDQTDEMLKVGLSLDEAKFGMRKETNMFGRANTFGFMGLRAEGYAGLPKGMVPGLDFGASGRVMLDTFDKKFEIEGHVQFQIVELDGLLTLRFTESGVPIPDNFVFVVGGEPGIPLIPIAPVAFITKGGGGFRNLYDTVTGNFNVLPPLKVVMVGGLSIAKVITADNVTLGLSMRGMEFSGEFEILKFPILKEVYGSVDFQDSLTNFGIALRAGARLEIFDAILGEVYVVFEYDSSKHGLLGPVYMAGGGSLTVRIPRAVPIVGGKEIAHASGEISSEKVWGKVRIIGIPFGYQYAWGSRRPTLASSRLTADMLPEAEGLMEKEYIDDSGNVSAMTFGTNIKRVASSKNAAATMKSADRVSILSSSNEYEIPVTADQEAALFELKYTGETPPNLQVTDPSGHNYPLTIDENYLVQEISPEDSQSGTLEKRVYVSIQKQLVSSMAGTWKVKSDQPLEWSLMDVTVPATLSSVTAAVDPEDNKVIVNWQGDHTTNEKVSLFLSTNNENDPGRLLVKDISVQDGTTEITLPETIASGSYYVKAVLTQGDTNLDSKYSGAAITIVNPLQPVQPQEVKALPAGSGLLGVSWKMPQTVDGYTIQLLDENNKPVKGLGTVDVPGDAKETTLGGMIKDDSGATTGLVPGSTYKVSIGAYTKVEGGKVYSEPAISAGAYLPVPNPAKVELTQLNMNNEPITNSYGESGNSDQKTYVVNEKSFQLQLHADQTVSTVVRVNNKNVDTFSGADWKKAIPLEEGTNLIELLSTNTSGDQTRSGTRVFSDTTAPDLKIERLGSISSDKTVLVKGVAEPGSKVSINGERITVETDGAFEHALPIEGYLSKSIVVTATDDADNVTTYSSEVMNQAVGAFVKVELRPVAETLGKLSADGEELSLPAGSKQSLELIGVDKNGVSTVIDPTHVGWSVILGDANGSVTEDGKVEANYEGELVVKASYAVTTEYAFEDTLIVKVGKKTDAPPPSKPNYDDWYIPPTPPNPNPDGEGSSGDSQQKADKVVEETLQNILKRLIELELDVEFVTSAKLVPNQETIVKIRDRAALRFAAQPMQENVGLGIGAVRNSKAYEGEGLKVIGDIYEFKFDKPIKLKEPAELTIRFSLEEIQDPSKAGIYWYNERTKKWEYIGGVMNPLAGTITVKLPHFSKYALLYNADMKDFKDMNNRWSRDMVYRLASIGAVNGINQGDSLIFEPTRSITRQEFAKIVVGAMGTALSSNRLPTEYADRDDVAPWAVPYMSTALTNQWLGGTSSQNELYLAPSVPISRAEAIAMIGRILKAGESKTVGAGSSFLDGSMIPAWANDYVPMLVEQGIISGYPDGMLRPNNEITREEAVAMISRMMDRKLN
ncbi:S-layer homology domain-containing protein [Paenibacillus frigoriresistens]|uniref:S-layer homology domain-containing protein n=1 Tax=Paenibacillus alginolyticus TaxID=59839 RepID=UPI001564A386|nr:S-layer homology domain-containing protein [Paenibacillus frigoriresistens]NRF90347.1 S-layer homology domain-containing protein [Paenibacillus frigoriresistens]